MLGGRFEIEAVVHRSSMSTVYRAQHRPLHGPVAIKQVSVQHLCATDKAEAQRWLAREAGLLSFLDHPMLPKLVAAFSEGDEHYVVVPFFAGKTLKELVVQSGPLHPISACRWTSALVDLLIYLHGQDPPILHRDIKPDNLLITAAGSLIALDLGIARPRAPGVPVTAIGTPGYAAPEQYQGLADERTDLYGLGATLHHMLTGYDADRERPFCHPPIRQLNPRVGPAMEALVAQLLCLVPDQRPSSAEEVRDDLKLFERFHVGLLGEVYYRWYARRQLMRTLPLALVSLGAAALADVAGTGSWDWLRYVVGWPIMVFVACLAMVVAALALQIPRAAAAAVRAGTAPTPRLRLSRAGRVMIFCLGILYLFALSDTARWITEPAVFVLPAAVIGAGWCISEMQSERALRRVRSAMHVPATGDGRTRVR
jgi:hypothetical protein